MPTIAPALFSTGALRLIRDHYGIDLRATYAVDAEAAEARGDALLALQARAAETCVRIAGNLAQANRAAADAAGELHREVGAAAELFRVGRAAELASAVDNDDPPSAVCASPVERMGAAVAAAGALDGALRAALEMFPAHPQHGT